MIVIKEKSQQAEAATQIKKLLKKEFPKVKFSVNSSRFSGGNDVNIEWNLGPTTEEVNQLVRKYQYGSFNGMIDLYEYDNKIEGIPQAKYVLCQRNYRTDEEIKNYKLPWKEAKDLYQEEKTLYHVIAKEICALAGIPFVSINTKVEPPLSNCYQRGDGCIDWNNLVYRLINEISFLTDSWEGYKVDFDVAEDGQKITNKFRIVKR